MGSISSKKFGLARYAIWSGAFLVALFIVTIDFPDGASTLILLLVSATAAIALFRHYTEDKEFVTTLFLGALVVRLVFGIFIHVFGLREFFGGDALTYDAHGSVIAGYWNGEVDSRNLFYQWASSTTRAGWGMSYVVAVIYYVAGKNVLAAQSFCAVIGAATAPMVFFCSKKLFSNTQVARLSALAYALFPSFIIWSGQLLKDGIVIFLLVVVMTMVLQLQKKFSPAAVCALLLSLASIITIRFYIFYMVVIAVAGSFVVGASENSTSILKRSAALVFLGLGLTYFGVIRTASTDLDRYAYLERIQVSRLDLARSADSGFSEEADVSTAEGAIAMVPLGLAYLMLAPFPWQVSNLRQAITLPDVLLWWAMIPLMIWGILFSVRHRLRSTFPILFFSATLMLAYSIFQGNVGTAYRQRTQIQVFLFMFIAVGWVLWKEKREDRKAGRLLEQRRFDDRTRIGARIS